MSDFEFFFSFYGLLLGLSVVEIAAGVARTVHEKRAVRIGVLTPLLAVFVSLDIASFWMMAWEDYRDIPFGFGPLVIGMVTAMIFYVAASLVFPRDMTGWPDLDVHFWAHRRLVLGGVFFANVIAAGGSVWRWFRVPGSEEPIGVLGVFFYGALIAMMVTKNRVAVIAMLSLNILLYIAWLPGMDADEALRNLLG